MEFVKKGAINSRLYWKHEGVEVDWDNGELPPRIAVERIRKYTRDFLSGLDYLHNHARIIHRDIKPDNLLVDESDTLKIADYGVAHIMHEGEDIVGQTGTKAFLPPEVFAGVGVVKGRSADIWATGITFFMLSFGYPPFFAKTVDKLKELVINSEPEFPAYANPDLVDWILCCLRKDPRKRASLLQLMEHDWVSNHGTTPLEEQEYDRTTLLINDRDMQRAFTKIAFRATVKITATLNHKIRMARKRLVE
jgi:[calcium/calmodulin-dependent protein kinase] kinase